VDERYAQEVANINQKLDDAEEFQLETTGRMAAIDTKLRWIKGIGAFIGAAIVAFACSLLYMSNKAGHVEEAVSTLQGQVKSQDNQLAKVLSALERIEARTAK
jgi:cell division protein FtsL